MTKAAKVLTALLLLLPAWAQAWWNADWKQRTAVILNTSDAGVAVRETLAGVAVPVRLHSGNFDFVGAKADGSDLRVLAGDDKTPLKFWVERFDSVNELAVLWVQVPTILPGTDKNLVYIYAGNDKAASDANGAGSAAAVADAATLATFHFAEKDGVAADQTGTIKATAAAAAAVEPNGLIGPSARIAGTALVWPANSTLKVAAGVPFSLSVWRVRMLPRARCMPKVRCNCCSPPESSPRNWAPPAWPAATCRRRLVANRADRGVRQVTVYVNGVQAGQGDLPGPSPAIDGDIRVGEGYQGLIDELELAGTARSADWIKLSYAAQSADAKLIAARRKLRIPRAAPAATATSGFCSRA